MKDWLVEFLERGHGKVRAVELLRTRRTRESTRLGQNGLTRQHVRPDKNRFQASLRGDRHPRHHDVDFRAFQSRQKLGKGLHHELHIDTERLAQKFSQVHFETDHLAGAVLRVERCLRARHADANHSRVNDALEDRRLGRRGRTGYRHPHREDERSEPLG